MTWPDGSSTLVVRAGIGQAVAERAAVGRFMNFVEDASSDDQCWLWLGSVNAGVPKFTHRGRRVAAARFAWEQWRGVVPPGKHVTRSCQQRLCVNPAHLALGVARPFFDFEANFHARVKRSRPDACWPWTGPLNASGGAVVSRDGRLVQAQRVAFELANGMSSAGWFVRQTCGEPACVNPSHLDLSSRSANAKLTDEDIRVLRQRREAGAKLRELAEAFGVSMSCVCVNTNARPRPKPVLKRRRL